MAEKAIERDNPVNLKVVQEQRAWIGFVVGDKKVARVSDQGVIEVWMTNEELLDMWRNGPDNQAKFLACVLMQLRAMQKRVYGDNMLVIAEDMRGLFGKLHLGHGMEEIVTPPNTLVVPELGVPS
jgi:hypothetical protein